MSTYSEWAEAFTIFAKYSDENHPLVAEHDEIYAGHNIKQMSPQDAVLLVALGWIYDEDLPGWLHYA